MLKVKNLEVKYGVIEAVRGISFEIKEGQIVTLIGSNGAGKTSTLNGIMNLIKKNGEVEFLGEDISKLSTDKIVKKGLSLIPEGRRVFINLSVDENLDMGGFNQTDIEKDKSKMYELFPRLKDKKNQLAGTLSGGEQQMLAIARALMAKPKILLMDEPSLGLAPIVVKEIFYIIRQLNEEGVTILLVEQNARMALKVAHRVYLLEQGKVSFSGSPEEIQQDEVIKRAYLGTEIS